MIQPSNPLTSESSATSTSTPSFGIDTSVLVRLLTGDPPHMHAACLQALRSLVQGGAKVFASNQVIGEAYVVVQLHYGVNKTDAQAGLLVVLEGDLVTPLNGDSALSLLRTSGGAGLFDRLIADGYAQVGLTTLTLDRQMAALPTTRLL